MDSITAATQIPEIHFMAAVVMFNITALGAFLAATLRQELVHSTYIGRRVEAVRG